MTATERVLFLPIEVSARELDGKLCLSAEALNRGWTVVVGHKLDVAQAAVSFGNGGVYLGKGVLRPGVDLLYSLLRDSGAKILGQNEEAGLQYPSFRNFYNEAPSMLHIDSLDAYLCWGNTDYQFLSRRVRASSPNSTQIVHLTGSSRASLWGDFGRRYYAEEIESNIDRFGDYLLFSTSFASGNYILSDADYSKFMKESKFFPTFSMENHLRIASRDRSNLKLFSDTILELSSQESNSIVIRPHPDEDVTFWKRVARGRSNVFVESSGDVMPLVMGAKALIHNSSTVALQAHGNVPHLIELDEVQPTASGGSLPTMLSVRACGARDIIKIVENTSDTSPVPGAIRRLSNRVGGRGDSSNLRNIVNVVDSLDVHSVKRFEVSSGHLIQIYGRSILRRVMEALPLNLVPIEQKVSARKRPLLRSGWVARKLEHASSAMGYELDATIENYGGRLIVLRSKK